MYFWQTVGVKVFQNCFIPALSSARLCGLTSLRRYVFMEPQTFSIGFKSGLEAGVLHQLMFFLEKNSCVYRLVCLGSLSCWNLCPAGNFSWRKGRKPALRMSVYTVEIMVPVNNTIGVAPRFDIPPHTCIFGGVWACPCTLEVLFLFDTGLFGGSQVAHSIHQSM